MRRALLLTEVRLGILRVRVVDAMSSKGLGPTASVRLSSPMHGHNVRAYSQSIHVCRKAPFQSVFSYGAGKYRRFTPCPARCQPSDSRTPGNAGKAVVCL